MKLRIGIRILGVAAALLLGLATSVSLTSAGGDDEVPGRYIVVLKEGVDPDDVASKHGLSIEHRYSKVANGFSASGGKGKLKSLKDDDRVAFAEADRRVSLFGNKPPVAPLAGQTLPTGVNRIDADASATAKINGIDERVDVDIAILDTGIQMNHPDLNVVGGKNCASGKFDDGNGHGTHVAGTAAAKDNGTGVVGVAPGARLWSVRVLDNRGNGFLSWVICGVDWVTSNADKIEVANMSLGGEFTSPSLDLAIARSVAAGVTYTVAAGNSAKDAATFSPANHPDVIAVSAVADFNGAGGGGAAATCRADVDDTFADFSNFGASVDVAAPGVCIYSTYRRSGYATMSGTSMASPHVAGAAALVMAANPVFTPSDVRAALLAAAKPQSDPDYGFTGDPDDFAEPMLSAGGL